MSIVIGRLKLRWNADTRIEPSGGVAPVSLATQRWMTSLKHIIGRVLSALLGPDAVFHGTLLVSFALLATWGILHHAMWRDELQAWLVAVDSRSLWELLSNLRLETHPFMWHLLLYGLSRFTANPIAMQLLHLALAVTTIWVFLRFSPFRRVEKALFIFGYFPVYEYCLISRDYVLVVLLVFLLCTLLQHWPRRYIAIAVVLFCLPNVHAYGFVLALAFLVFLVFEKLLGRRDRLQSQPRWKLPLAALITMVGFGLGLWKCLLVPSSMWKHALTCDRLTESVITIWRAYVPIPFKFPYWPTFEWGTNFLCDSIAPPVFVSCGISAALAICAAGFLVDRPKGIVLYSLITGGVLLFQFLFGGGALRQAGLLFIGLIAVFWLSTNTFEGTTCGGVWGGICKRVPNWRRSFLMVLLAIHLSAGVYAYTAEQTIPFSGCRDAAQFLRRRGLAQAPIVGSRAVVTQGVAAYLQRPIYFADMSRLGRYCPFQEPEPASVYKMIDSAYQLFEKNKKDVVLVLSLEMRGTVNGREAPISEMYVGPKGPYLSPNGVTLSFSEVRQLPLPRVKIKRLAAFERVTTDEACFVYILGLER